MNDGVQQQTRRVYENVALLALDLLARIIVMQIDPGSPCMGAFLSSGFEAGHVVLIVSLFDLESRFFAPTRSIAKPARAGAFKVGRRPNLAAYSASPDHTLTASSTTARLVRSE